MDITSLAGLAVLAALTVIGAISGELPKTFLNLHGLVIVLGGAGGAILMSTPLHELIAAIKALRLMIGSSPYPDEKGAVAVVVKLAEDVRGRGASAWQDADAKAVGGYLRKAADVAAALNDADAVEEYLEKEINADFDRNNEAVNFYRTLSILSPMFGLLGTLIGIVGVLKDISNPEAVGAAMAVSMTTAFYGISLANAVCVPIAGKLRLRYIRETRAKAVVCDGIVLIMKGAVPAVIERKLQAHI
jgi:chemotaxis protein MotA